MNRCRALVSLVYRLGSENGKVQGNPARLVKHQLANNARTRWLAPDGEARLRPVIDTSCKEHLPELDLALHTGLRRGEQYGLM